MDRFHFDANITAQDAADSYLPAFESCVVRGGASSIMCSYNAVNGVPSCANHELLTDIARNKWNFDGYITSDCGAVNNVYDSHHFTSTPEEAVKSVFSAGMDIECGKI